MKRILLAGIALVAFGVPAFAADTTMNSPAPLFSWQGAYAGIEGGYGWGQANRSIIGGGLINRYDIDGGTAGGLAGYNWQNNEYVLGVEGRLGWADVSGDDGGVGGTVDHTKLRWLGSLVGRLGYTQGSVLYFVNGGWAFAGAKHTNDGPPVQSFTRNVTEGWTLGAGVEWAYTANWTVRLDYRYYNLDYKVRNPAAVAPFEVDNNLSTVTIGASYKY